jgi:hypothetical protein
MKPIYVTATAILFALAAAAQDAPLAPQVKVMGIQGAVMSKTVKGAPYSAVEVNETTQMLADGTRIHNESQTQVYRDSEGRVRREMGANIAIYDPVANASFVLNPKNQTVRKLPLGTYVFTSNANGSKTDMQYFRFSTTPDSSETLQKLADLKAAVAAGEGKTTSVTTHSMIRTGGMEDLMTAATRKAVSANVASESLGKRMIEGLNADGTRETSTIEVGAIGNDRAIQIVSERWYSSDLQTIVQTRHADPRTGEETFKLTNVNRSEPAAYLFQVPAGYTQIQ